MVLHESNAIPGRVTRLLGRLCGAVAIGLPLPPNVPSVDHPGTPVVPVSDTTTTARMGAPGGEPLLVVMGGSQGAVGLNRMVLFAQPPGSGVPGGASHGGNDPEINQLRRNLAERRFGDDIPGLLNMPTWPSAVPVPEASVNSPSAELTVLVPTQAADRHQDTNAACAASFGA